MAATVTDMAERIIRWSGRLTCLPCMPRKIDLDGDGTLTEEEFVGVREGLKFAGG